MRIGRSISRYLCLAASGCLPAAPALLSEVSTPGPEQVEFFERRIRPVLVEHCYECHSASSSKLKGGLRLDSRESVLKGGDSGPALVAGAPDESLLIKAVRYHDDSLQMPPKNPLPAGAVADLEAWVKMGAPDPREEPSAATGPGNETAKTFWSFQPVQDPEPPAVRNTRWPRNDIDRFLLAQMESKGLAPAADADKRTLIRRVTFDLTGLPPTPGEVRDFLADSSSRAFERVVDRLLASPRYGERWGRHWLDLVRYADTSGCNSDYPVPTARLYRDYVIRSFNEDKPYDAFIREQIAGDLLPHASEAERFERIIATGYLAISRRFGSRASEFHLTLEDTIDNLGKSVLGLSVSCARCHDHKYDPVSIEDYYALYGIFNSTRYAFPGTEIYRHTKDFIPLAGEDAAREYHRETAELAALDDTIEKLLEKKRAFERLEKKEVARVDDDGAAQVERKDQVNLPEYQTVIEVKAALEDARSRQRALENKTYPFVKAYAVAEAPPSNARVQKKGDPRNLGDEVPRRFLEVLGGDTLPSEATGSGRLELAGWLTSPQNPLTARVMVNRIWQHHFGRGLVATPNDFGTRGSPPSHPRLLDYLATRLIAGGWSVKSLHKLILLSHAYQLSSRAEPLEADPDNTELTRFNRRRLSAEEIRDSFLFLGGSLEFGAPDAHPFPPEAEWRYTQHKPFVQNYESNHRTVYLMQQRIRKHPYLEIFDGADPNATTPDRPLNTTPIQALFMMNDPLAHEQADRLAVRVGMAYPADADRIDYAYQLVLGRPPAPEEVRVARDYLRDCVEALKETDLPADRRPRAALASFMRVLLSGNEFMYID